MKRVVHKASSHEEAGEWDVERHVSMEACRSTPELRAECIVGATLEDKYLGYFMRAERP